ncbi:MAG: DNA topoisomerase, partial [Anaerovoracaceae bacterium]
MILIIAEKSDLAKIIATVLPGTLRKEGPVLCKGEYVITYTGGHALTFVDPEEIDEKYNKWEIEDLPIYFDPWKKRAVPGKGELLASINRHLKNCEYVIHAGDVDDEGQFLIDEVLEYYKYSGKVLRLNTANTTEAGMRKAMQNLTDNGTHVSAGKAAMARAISDKAFGYSLSRLYSIINKQKISIGRVQTPTLGLVVERDRLIEEHVKSKYYELFADSEINGSSFTAKLKISKESVLLEDGKIVEKSIIEEIQKNIIEKKYNFTLIKKEETESPPLPFNLVKLQSAAFAKWGYTPKDTMEITQSLRDNHKAITYNRSDCRYLTSDNHAEAPLVIKNTLDSIKWNLSNSILVNPQIKSKAFNDKNVKLHFAIIPSGEKIDLDKLSEKEKNVYELIAKYYLVQFLPAAQKEKVIITASIDKEKELVANSTKITYKGYREFLKPEEAESESENNEELHKILPGEYCGVVLSTNIVEKETSPPKRYTQASLAEDMTRIAKYVKDLKVKELLLSKDKESKDENGSIGTTATRDTIITTLINRKFIEENGKTVIST